MKNSGSGPKITESAMPVDLRYFSAFFATDLGSLSYPRRVLGSKTSHLMK